VKSSVVWTRTVWELFMELPNRERDAVLEKVALLESFPLMYPIRIKGRRFRRYRWLVAGNWLVYYRVVDNIVYVRGLWPAQIP
jgi:hypothetical protein